jgi:23S rRNA pseudouridine955/2504/2580 synthase
MSVSDPASSVRYLSVDEDSAGQRLDNFLIRELKGVPKTHVYRIIRSGEVRRNKGRVSADDRVQAGDVIRVPPLRVAEPKSDAVAIPPFPAKSWVLVYEDEHFLAISKPDGMAVHGGSGVSFGVIEQLRAARPQSRYLELVHRLDRETSGLLLIAKRKSALNALQDQFRARTTDKVYLSLVKGVWPEGTRRLDAALHKYELPDGERRVRVVPADHPHAMPSLTLVRRLAVLPTVQGHAVGVEGFSLLAVTIKTGRTHQIRVHLSHAGYPIVGDDKYGDFELNREIAKVGFRRMFLHAWRLRIDHPMSNESIQLEAKLPANLRLTELMQLGVQ